MIVEPYKQHSKTNKNTLWKLFLFFVIYFLQKEEIFLIQLLNKNRD